MADKTYELTLRFEAESDTMAACLAHELLMCLKPVMGTTLATNPRVWAFDGPGGRDSHSMDLAYRQATTHERDMAHRYVHAYTSTTRT